MAPTAQFSTDELGGPNICASDAPSRLFAKATSETPPGKSANEDPALPVACMNLLVKLGQKLWTGSSPAALVGLWLSRAVPLLSGSANKMSALFHCFSCL